MIEDSDVLYEDNHLIIVNKKNGEIVQGDRTGDWPLSEKVRSYLTHKYNKPGNAYIGVCHRLDRPVSGAIVFTKTSKALRRMNEIFKNKEAHKVYWAIVKNLPPETEGNLVHYLVRKSEKNRSIAYPKEVPGSKRAELNYRVVSRSDQYYLLEVELLTGRHHQIRCQLAAIGCPIKGDLKYGFPRSNPGAGISLHARQLSFIHPVQKTPIEVVCPVPDDPLWEVFQNKVLP